MSQVICLYSEQSPKSREILESAQGLPFMQFVCIDNPKLRKRVMSSKALSVTKVPTIIVIRDDGIVEKYDDTAGEWLQDVLKNMSEPQPGPPETTPLDIPQGPPEAAQPPMQPPQPPQQPPRQQVPMQQVPMQPPQPSQQPQNVTAIDLGGTQNEDLGVDYPPQQQPMQEQHQFPPPVEHQALPPQSSSQNHGTGILAAAEAMQRERKQSSQPRQ